MGGGGIALRGEEGRLGPGYMTVARSPPHWFVEPLIGTALYPEIYIGLGCGLAAVMV